MKVRTHVRGGRISSNHNQTLAKARGLRVKSAMKGGRISANHNQTLR
jgi:hypothetical protein